MGYRLAIENKSKTIEYYGTKLYGYLDSDIKLEQLPSFKWLIKHNKFKTQEEALLYFEIYSSDKIELTAEEFKEFITLYAADYKKHSWYGRNSDNLLKVPKIKNLIASKENKIINWE